MVRHKCRRYVPSASRADTHVLPKTGRPPSNSRAKERCPAVGGAGALAPRHHKTPWVTIGVLRPRRTIVRAPTPASPPWNFSPFREDVLFQRANIRRIYTKLTTIASAI